MLAFETEEPHVLSFLELESGTPKPEAVAQPPGSDADLDALSVSAASPSLPPSPLPAGPSASEPVHDGPSHVMSDLVEPPADSAPMPDPGVAPLEDDLQSHAEVPRHDRIERQRRDKTHAKKMLQGR